MEISADVLSLDCKWENSEITILDILEAPEKYQTEYQKDNEIFYEYIIKLLFHKSQIAPNH